jgi:hypothetical protein
VFNDAGADVDFRVESDTVENALFVDGATGNVGVGATPSFSVDVVRSGGDAQLRLMSQATGTNGIIFRNNAVPTSGKGAILYPNGSAVGGDTMQFVVDNAERMRIDTSGKVGIGTTAMNYKLNLREEGTVGDTSVYMQFTTTDTGTANTDGGVIGLGVGSSPIMYVTNYENAALAFSTNNTERMRITSGGNFLVGGATTTTGFAVIKGVTYGEFYISMNHPTSTPSGYGYADFLYNGGLIGNISQNGTTAVAYNTTSDYRLKENVAPMTGALAKVLELNPVTYTWKVDGSAGQGFIAHELQTICPDAVTGEKDATEIRQVEVSPAVPATYDDEGNELTPAVEAVYEEREVPKYQGMDTSFLVATLTAAIQELKAELDEAKARIAALEGQ